jgi:hypothetical protein
LTAQLFAGDTAVVRAAAHALLLRADQQALVPLLHALVAEEPDDEVGVMVELSLNELRPEWFIRGCVRLIEDRSEDPAVRVAAAEALGALHAREALSVLRRVLDDEAEEVRKAARDALRRLLR